MSAPLRPSLSVLANAKAQLEEQLRPTRSVVRELSASLGAPRRLLALTWLAKAHHAARVKDAAAKDHALSQAAQASPDYFRPYSYRGYWYLLQGSAGAARSEFERALQLKIDDVGARVGAVRACRALGDTGAAVDHLRRALWADHGPRLVHEVRLWQLLVELADNDKAGKDALATAWPLMLSGLTEPLRDVEAMQYLLRTASLLGHDDVAASIAAWLRTQAPPGAGTFRQVFLQLTGGNSTARQAARLFDSLSAIQEAKKNNAAKVQPPQKIAPTKRPRTTDLVQTCLQWEETHPVETWRVNDIHVWPLIRTQLAFQRLAESRGASQFENNRPPKQTPDEGLARHWLGSVFEQMTTLKPADVVTMGTSSERILLDGRWFNSLLDPVADVLDTLGRSSVHLELRNDGHSYRRPQHRPSLKLRPAVWGLMHYAPPAPTWRYEMSGYEAFQDAEGLQQSAAYWERRVHRFERVTDFFVDLFGRLQPKLLIVICHYAWLSRAAVLAARRLGIRTADLQHGVTSGHPMYEGWSKHPAEGYALLPEYYWSWSAADAERIAQWGGKAVAGGHPWLNECRRRGLNSQDLPRGRVNVLVSLNWSSGFDDRLKSAISAAPEGWMFWVRLHPKMPWQRQEIANWCAANAPHTSAVTAPTDLPLFAVLAAADLHLSLSSTVTQEAARLDVPSVCLDPRAEQMYAAEAEAGWMFFEAGTATQVIDALQLQLNRQGRFKMAPYPEAGAMQDALRFLLD